MNRILRAAVNSWNGLRAAFQTEAAFRQEAIIFALAIPLSFVVTAETWKRLTLIAVVALVLVVELLNTAIEKISDRITLAVDPIIQRVKDMGSAAVGLMLLIAGLIWLAAVAERFGLI